jgi:hypothetical protein
MEIRRCACQRFVKTVSFREPTSESTQVNGMDRFRHILPVDDRPEGSPCLREPNAKTYLAEIRTQLE